MRLLLALLVAAQPCLGATLENLPEGRPTPVAPVVPGAPLTPQLPLQLDLGGSPEQLSLPPSTLTSGATAAPAADASMPSRQLSPLPSALTAKAITASAATPASLPARLRALTANIGRLTGFGKDAPAEASSGDAERTIRMLQGVSLPAADSSDGAVAAPPPSGGAPRSLPPESKRAVRLMMWGTPAFKLGAEVVTLSLPQLVLAQASHGAAGAVAMLLIVYQLSQAAIGMATPALLRRFPASKVLAGSIATQGLLVAALVGLSVAHAATAWAILPFYGLLGGAIGVADTARRLIPTLLLGHDEVALRDYNARLHRRYETAGVMGAALGGALIALVGPLYAMVIQPPAYLVSAWLFLKVRHPRQGGASGEDEASWRDVFKGAAKVARDPKLRWLAAAMVVPQVIHRVFENLVLPVYAKTILGAGALAAALLTASNLGELGGASFLLKRSKRYPGPSSWVRWAGFGLLAGWMLPVAGLHWPVALALAALAPAIFLFSSTWAGSHLSLESEAQKTVSQNEQPGVVAFLNGAFILATAAASFGLGKLLDSAGTMSGLVWICSGFTASALLLWSASRRFKYNRAKS